MWLKRVFLGQWRLLPQVKTSCTWMKDLIWLWWILLRSMKESPKSVTGWWSIACNCLGYCNWHMKVVQYLLRSLYANVMHLFVYLIIKADLISILTGEDERKQRVKILLAEDNAINQRIFRVLLGRYKYRKFYTKVWIQKCNCCKWWIRSSRSLWDLLF